MVNQNSGEIFCEFIESEEFLKYTSLAQSGG